MQVKKVAAVSSKLYRIEEGKATSGFFLDRLEGQK